MDLAYPQEPDKQENQLSWNNGNTVLNMMFNAGLNQHDPQTPAHTSQLPVQLPRPTSTQSATGPITAGGLRGQGNRSNSTPP